MADDVPVTGGAGYNIATDDVGGRHFQRVKVAHGAEGSATDVSSAAPLPVDTELAAAAALADAAANPTAPTSGAAGLLYNGSTWDRVRSNQEVTLLATAARVASTFAPAQTNYNAAGVLLILDVGAASGTGGLKVGMNVGSSFYLAQHTAQTAITASGKYGFLFYPGSSPTVSNTAGHLRAGYSVPLPRVWTPFVEHGDASSYTYNLTGYLIR